MRIYRLRWSSGTKLRPPLVGKASCKRKTKKHRMSRWWAWHCLSSRASIPPKSKSKSFAEALRSSRISINRRWWSSSHYAQERTQVRDRSQSSRLLVKHTIKKKNRVIIVQLKAPLSKFSSRMLVICANLASLNRSLEFKQLFNKKNQNWVREVRSRSSRVIWSILVCYRNYMVEASTRTHARRHNRTSQLTDRH